MKTPVIITLLILSAVAIVRGVEATPERPTPEQIAKLLGIDETRVSTDDKVPHPRLDGKVLWVATYNIAGDQDCSLSITLVPDGRIKADFIGKIGADQKDFQKVTREDGDLIYHALGDRGDQGTFYMTTLINHEGDWDMTLILSREPNVEESKLPFTIEKDGIRLVSEVETLIRQTKKENKSEMATPRKPYN